MGTIWEQPSPSDFDRWEAELAEGVEPSAAARKCGYTASAFRRADKTRHAELMEMSKEARGHFVDRHMEKLATEDDPNPSIVTTWAKRWNPEYRERQSIEVSGTIEHEHRGVFAIGELVELAGKLGVLDQLELAHGRSQDALPSAEEVHARPARAS